MSAAIAELDYVEVTAHQRNGLLDGARGTVVAVHTDFCTLEFVDPDGYTIGLFDVPTADLRLVQPAGSGVSVAREE